MNPISQPVQLVRGDLFEHHIPFFAQHPQLMVGAVRLFQTAQHAVHWPITAQQFKHCIFSINQVVVSLRQILCHDFPRKDPHRWWTSFFSSI